MAVKIARCGICPETIEEFLEQQRRRGRKEETLNKYRRELLQLADYFPGDRLPESPELISWQNHLLKEGYSLRTVKARISSANSFFAYLGRRDLQMDTVPLPEVDIQPELTRAEYLRLLQAAKLLEKERLYLLVKVFGSIGFQVQDLVHLTVEAVRTGKVIGARENYRVPGNLRRELLDYAERARISGGPIFMTKGGRPLDRTNLTMAMKQLCQTALVAEEKATPRCLRKLCLDTQNEILGKIRRLAEQSYDHLLETEELTVGWNEYAKAE